MFRLEQCQAATDRHQVGGSQKPLWTLGSPISGLACQSESPSLLISHAGVVTEKAPGGTLALSLTGMIPLPHIWAQAQLAILSDSKPEPGSPNLSTHAKRTAESKTGPSQNT